MKRDGSLHNSVRKEESQRGQEMRNFFKATSFKAFFTLLTWTRFPIRKKKKLLEAKLALSLSPALTRTALSLMQLRRSKFLP